MAEWPKEYYRCDRVGYNNSCYSLIAQNGTFYLPRSKRCWFIDFPDPEYIREIGKPCTGLEIEYLKLDEIPYED